MKKTKHFNISVPELGDVPDITQVSNAISDLEDATAGTLEIMKAEMQGTKITLTSVSRKTKRTGYYEGMSIRFKSPQDIEPNYLKTISVDGLSDQTLSVEYKVNRNEYIDIVYEGNKFTAYPVVVRKTDSVSNNSSVLVGTAKGVKTAYDKGVEALNKANQAQVTADKKEDRFNKKSGFNLDKTSALEDEENKLQTAKGVLNGDLAVVGSNSLHSFPLSNATKGSIYYHKGTNRYYICTESYSGSSLTNPNASFEELSVYTNRQKLDNLITINENQNNIVIKTDEIDMINDKELKVKFEKPFLNKCLCVLAIDLCNPGVDPATLGIVEFSTVGFTICADKGPYTVQYIALGY